jgi:hypothetical protein
VTTRLPKHADVDSNILPLDRPILLFWWLVFVATTLVVVVSWLGLLAVMVAGWVAWRFWPYVVAPVLLWLALLALPAFFHARRGALAILEAIAVTAEAWLARAGYSVDLNRDGYIGRVEPVHVEKPEEIRLTPVITAAPQGVKLLARDAAINEELAGAQLDQVDEDPPARPRVWSLTNGVKVPQETVEAFVDGIFVRGWSRLTWVGKNKPLDRETYDSLIDLLTTAGLLVDRKPGAAGRLSVKTSRAARSVLKLPDSPG